MMDKMMMRKKAMESMVKEGPSLLIEIQKKRAMEQDGEDAKEGFVSMMVSMEEKKMLEEMRKEKKGEPEVEVEAEGMDESEDY